MLCLPWHWGWLLLLILSASGGLPGTAGAVVDQPLQAAMAAAPESAHPVIVQFGKPGDLAGVRPAEAGGSENRERLIRSLRQRSATTQQGARALLA